MSAISAQLAAGDEHNRLDEGCSVQSKRSKDSAQNRLPASCQCTAIAFIDPRMTLNSGSMLICAPRQELTTLESNQIKPAKQVSQADLPKNTLAAIQQHQMKMGETLGAVVSKDPVARQLRVVMALADVRHAVAYGSTMLPFVARAG